MFDYLRKSWLLECLALLGSILSLAGLVVLLALYDDQPVFQRYLITLNSLVSILSTATKSALMLALSESISQWKWIIFTQQRPLIDFDAIENASRGPLGSLQLLWKVHGATITRLGAITTIIALAIDPFTQQLVQYKQKVAYRENNEVTVTRAERYSKGNEYSLQIALDPSLNYSVPNTYADADFSMQAAVLDGLTQPLTNVIQRLPFQCPSGNCTWNPFESLAVCGVCNDLTDVLTSYEDLGALPSLLQMDNGALEVGNGTAFILPNGHYIDNTNGWQYYSKSDDANSTFPTGGAVYMTIYGTANASDTNSLTDKDTLIWATSILRVHPATDNASAAWPNLPVEALECGLYYCVNNYNSTVINGTLHEEVTPAINATRSNNSWVPSGAFAKDLNTSMEESLIFNGWYSVISRSDLQLGDKYNISQAAVDSISAYFQSTFTANVTVADYSESHGILNGFYMDDGNLQYTPSIMQALFSSSDLNGTFQSVARSMSNAIRTGADNGTVQTGENGTDTTFYKIVWPWIALHGIMVAGGSIFLALTMLKSRHGDIPEWKSSSLAILSRGPYMGDVLHGAASVSEMEKRAGKAYVQLYTDAEVGKDNSYIALTTIEVNEGSDVARTASPSV